MQLFSETSLVKNVFFFAHENMKKPPLKLAPNWSRFFFSVLGRLSKLPQNRNPLPPKAPKCRTGYLD